MRLFNNSCFRNPHERVSHKINNWIELFEFVNGFRFDKNHHKIDKHGLLEHIISINKEKFSQYYDGFDEQTRYGYSNVPGDYMDYAHVDYDDYGNHYYDYEVCPECNQCFNIDFLPHRKTDNHICIEFVKKIEDDTIINLVHEI